MEHEPAIPVEGSLAEFPLPVLLVKLYESEFTGRVAVSAPPMEKKIYLSEGAVIFASSSLHNDRLGEMLIRRGVIRVADYLAASRALEPGKRFGTILVERGTLTPQELVKAVKNQVKEIVFSIFRLSSGAFAIASGADASDEIITLNIDTPELIRLGIQRMDRVAMILEHMVDLDRRVALDPAKEHLTRNMDLAGHEKDLLGKLNRSTTILELLGDSALTDFERLKFAWALYILGVMVPRTDASEPEEAFPDPKDPGGEAKESPDSPPSGARGTGPEAEDLSFDLATHPGDTEAEVPEVMEDLGISSEDLNALGDPSHPPPPESIPSTPDWTDEEAETLMERLRKVSKILKGELGAASSSFLTQNYERFRLLSGKGDLPSLRVSADLEWSGALRSQRDAAFAHSYLKALSKQVDGLMPGPTADAIREIAEE